MNKTFTYIEDYNLNKYEIEIKKEICKLFSYILDIRQDFFIDNSVEYLITKFPLKLKEAKSSNDELEKVFEKDFIGLLPDYPLKVI
jgi:hypothetical protein